MILKIYAIGYCIDIDIDITIIIQNTISIVNIDSTFEKIFPRLTQVTPVAASPLIAHKN